MMNDPRTTGRPEPREQEWRIETDGGWHLDKRVPVALIVAILLQTFGFGFWLATQNARIERLEEFARDNKTVVTDMSVVTNRLFNIERSLQRIEDSVTAPRRDGR